jgi:hypothetical protein
VNVAKKVLQQFSGQKVPGGFEESPISGDGGFEDYALLIEHRSESKGGTLESVDAKVIGKRGSEALQKGIELGNNFSVFCKRLLHERQ